MKSFLFIIALLCSFFSMGQTTIVADGLNNTPSLFTNSGGTCNSGFSGFTSTPNERNVIPLTYTLGDFKTQEILATPEINISKNTSSSDIPSGSTANTIYNTVFTSTEIGSDYVNTYYIENEGTANLNIGSVTITGANSGDFSISTLPSTISTGSTLASSIPFTITFTPSASGIREAIISIASNDSDENPYTFNVEGNGTCTTNNSSLSPSSISEGGTLTISSSLDLSISNTVTLNGVSLPYTIVSSSQITVVIPSGANSGDLVITNHQGCFTTNSFTLIKNVFSGCEGGALVIPTELFISEVTDANFGGLTYIELHNGTGSSKNLNTYSIKFYNNGNTTISNSVQLPNFSLADGETYVVAVGTSPAICSGVFGSDASLANFSTVNGGVNFKVGENDHFKLYNGAVEVDYWGEYASNNWADGLGIGSEGANFRRKNTASLPNLTFDTSDWIIINWNDCSVNDYSDVGIYNLLQGTSPVVTVHPAYTPSCGTVTLNALGIESFSGGSGLTYQWYVNAPGSSLWFALNNSGVYSGTNTSALFISSTSSLNKYQYYCRVKEGSSSCYAASNTIMIFDDVSTWNGFFWNNGFPSISKKAVINGNYNTAVNGSFECCSLTVNASRTLTIASEMYVNIDDNLINNGIINVENNASIIQTNEVNTNTGLAGVYSIQRAATANNLDYIYWSAPVQNFNVSNLPNSHRYYWDTTDVNANGTEGNWIPAMGTMAAGIGYIARTAGPVNVNFNGIINNGSLSVGISNGSDSASINDNYNLIGNPYPSAIDVDAFLYENANPTGPNPVIEGSVHIWTHGTLPSNAFPSPFYQNFQNNYNVNDYLIVNGTGSSTGPASFNGKIASGQGFFVIKEEGSSLNAVNFNNAMRNKNHDNSNFFKSNANTTLNEIEKNRIWLNLIAQNGTSSRTLIGYVTGATLAKDVMFDAAIEPESMYLYSLIGVRKQAIQGRPVPFDTTDLVPLGILIQTAGDYTLAIAGVDGLFSNAYQNIYIEDTFLNLIHDLKQSPYIFTSVVGEFNNRFNLRYTNSLLSHPTLEIENDFSIIANENVIISSSKIIKSVEVYDLLGRSIYKNNDLNDKKVMLKTLKSTQDVLIVKTILEDKTIVKRKIIF